jgi:hypothetical protein
MLRRGQKRSKDIAALAAEQVVLKILVLQIPVLLVHRTSGEL